MPLVCSAGLVPRDAEASLGKIQGRLKLEARMWFRSSSAAAEPACDISNERKWRLVYRVLTADVAGTWPHERLFIGRSEAGILLGRFGD